MNYITKIANIVSVVFSPLLVPTYGILMGLNLSYLGTSSLSVRVAVTIVVGIMTCVIPFLLILGLRYLGKVSDIDVSRRRERTLPLILGIICYLFAGIYLLKANAPIWLVMFMAGAFAAAITTLIVNTWWKISAHMAGMGALLALVLRMAVSGYAIYSMYWYLVAVLLIAGVVGTSRLILERHTPLQVAAGALNGFLWTYILTIF